MKRYLTLIPFVIFLVLGVMFFFSIGRDTTIAANGMVGQLLPQFNLKSFHSGTSFEQADMLDLEGLQNLVVKGRPWIINVWASWCPQCYMEHEFVSALAEQGAVVIGVNYKDEYDKAQQFLARMGDSYDIVLWDQLGEFGFDLGVSGAPETYLISPEGRIMVRHAGALDRAVWDQQFAQLWQRFAPPLFNSVESQP